MALRDMTQLVYAYQSMRPGRPARSYLGNQDSSDGSTVENRPETILRFT